MISTVNESEVGKEINRENVAPNDDKKEIDKNSKDMVNQDSNHIMQEDSEKKKEVSKKTEKSIKNTEESKDQKGKKELKMPSTSKKQYSLISEDPSNIPQEMIEEIGNISLISMTTILTGREPEMHHSKKYSDFISEDILDKLILKYNKTHSFTVVVFLSTSNSKCFEISKGYIGPQDFYMKSEFVDDNWICFTLITMINRLSRDPMRKVENPEKLEGEIKKVMLDEMEKILSGKIWIEKYNNDDCTVIVQNILDKLIFKYQSYFFTLNCIIRNDDLGFTTYSNNYCFYSKEDSICFEIYNTNNDETAKNSIWCTIYASFFKNK